MLPKLPTNYCHIYNTNTLNTGVVYGTHGPWITEQFLSYRLSKNETHVLYLQSSCTNYPHTETSKNRTKTLNWDRQTLYWTLRQHATLTKTGYRIGTGVLISSNDNLRIKTFFFTSFFLLFSELFEWWRYKGITLSLPRFLGQ